MSMRLEGITSILRIHKLSFLFFLAESKEKKQSIPNEVKSRNKPIMMVIKKRGIGKKNESANMKMSRIKKHIRNLKKDTGKKKRFRKR